MAVPEKPRKGWVRVGGTIYRAIRVIEGKERYIFADVSTGNWEIQNDPQGDILARYNSSVDDFTVVDSTLFPKEDALSPNDRKFLEKDLTEAIYDINEKVAKNSSFSDIADGIGISKESQQEFYKNPRYQQIRETVQFDTIEDIDNLVSGGSIAAANPGLLKLPPEGLTYPLSQQSNDSQDYIQFTIGQYKPKDLKKENNLGKLSGNTTLTDIIGYINLPIQPSIVDSNSVDWNENRLNPLQVAGLQVGNRVVEEGLEGVEKIIKSLQNLEGSSDIIKAGKIQLAQEAVGAQNLVSRFGGAVINPNLELLFNGPQLRPFNFNFKLSPREEKEARVVRTIIRAFKQSMAPKVTTSGLFLAAPNIFQIKYIQAGGFDHPSLNRIKLCALKSCSVDYTPENSYMTFNDNSNTMVSYNMSLQFQELEPVTDIDYQGIATDEIGF